MSDNDTEDELQDVTVSKSQVKRELDALRKLGEQLVQLPPSQLDTLVLSERIREAIKAARSFKRKALKRQLGLIGGLMREEDIDEIRLGLDRLKAPQQKAVAAMHDAEAWRDRLLDGDLSLIDELALQFDVLDRQYIRQLVRNAGKEKLHNKPPKSARALYKYLHDLRSGA